ncbi:MAG: TIM barrel protein [Acidimicrobiales bacterium]
MALDDRLAGAPISWGICEVPGWGEQLAPARVLREMAGLGLGATELGPIGWLPTDRSALTALVRRHGLRLLGGFVPLVLHEPSRRPAALAAAARTAAVLAAADAEVFVTAAVVDDGWSRRRPLGDEQWSHLFQMLDEIDDLTAEHGLRQVVHPHVDTVIETEDDVRRVHDGTAVGWCLDTGHLAIGGTDPLAFAEEAGDRVAHVHLKDVDQAVADRLNAGDVDLMAAVHAGLFRPLGDGALPVADVIETLERGGYRGWYVLEQDVALSGSPAEGDGPVQDVARSIDFVRSVFASQVGTGQSQEGE